MVQSGAERTGPGKDEERHFVEGTGMERIGRERDGRGTGKERIGLAFLGTERTRTQRGPEMERTRTGKGMVWFNGGEMSYE